MNRYRLTLWVTHEDTAGALVIDEMASTPGAAIDKALHRYRLPYLAVLGWEQVTKFDAADSVRFARSQNQKIAGNRIDAERAK